MNIIKERIKKVFLCMLVFFAAHTTYYQVTGVEAGMVDVWESGFSNETISVGNRITNLTYKSLPKIAEVIPAISSAEAVQGKATLEATFNYDQYPKHEVVATGYTAGFESTGKYPGDPAYGITYSGVKVKRDLYSTVAADLKVFPIGTILFIPNYGYGVVADKGGAIKGNKLDLYYDTVADVYDNWGKKTLEVYIVKKGEGKLTEEEFSALNEDENVRVFRQQYMLNGKK